VTGAFDALDEAALERVSEQPFPDWLEPQLAVLTDDYFSDPDWVFERKLDGVRLLAFREDGAVRLMSRNRKNRNAAWPEIVAALEGGGPDIVIDGEVVALDNGVSSFSKLQARIGITDPDKARRTGVDVYFYAFDILHLDGKDVSQLPLRARKALLKAALGWTDPIRFTPHRNEDGEAYLQEACRKGWEGLIAKRADAPYRFKRSRDWLKFKCDLQQEFVIGGFTDPQGSRIGFGALLLGYHEDGELKYAGRVGTGFDNAFLSEFGEQLIEIERASPPFADPPKGDDIHWVTPKYVGEAAFTEWTDDGRLRHPRFLGLRDDKPPQDVVRERPQ